MNISGFIDRYNAIKSDDAKKKYIHDRINRKYIPFAEKMTVCNTVVESSHFQSGSFKLNSAFAYLFFTMALINWYTDIDVEYGNESNRIDEQYDQLKQNGLIDMLLHEIPEDEMREFSALMDYANSDVTDNNMSVRTVLDELYVRVSDVAVWFDDVINKVVANPEFIKKVQSNA